MEWADNDGGLTNPVARRTTSSTSKPQAQSQDIPLHSTPNESNRNVRNRFHLLPPTTATVPSQLIDGGQDKRRRKAASSCLTRIRRIFYRDRSIIFAFAAIYVICFTATSYYSRPSKRQTTARKRSLSPRRAAIHGAVQRRTSSDPHEIPILLPFSGDVNFDRGRIHNKTTSDFVPNYGGLSFRKVESFETGRTIHYAKTIEKTWIHHPEYLHRDGFFEFGEESRCKAVSWFRLYNPTCNMLHEFPLLEYKIISHGYFREAWLATTPNADPNLVIKTFRYKHKYRQKEYESVRMDALVMERLTSSPRIADVFGHCGTSIVTEAFSEEIEERIVPGYGYIKPDDLNDKEDVDVKNNYTATEKLVMALEMAESLADLHGFKDGVIVHDDVQPCQWLRTADGRMKLNDFNRAELMEWDEEHEEYCKYQNGGGYGNYRSPEEFDDRPLDEKIDIFSFGNNIYAMLTGLWNFYDTEDDEVAQKKIIDKKLPFVDERYRTRSYAEGELVKIMERCWVYEPKERVDIFEVVEFLRNAVKENARLGAKDKRL